MYTEIDLKKLPTRGVYYKDDLFIKVREFSTFEMASMNSMKSKTFMSKLRKLEFSLLAVDTNMDELDLCYVDVYYLYYFMYGLTYKEITVSHNGLSLLCPINPEDFVFSNPEFSKKEDLYLESLNLKLYHPSLYNMSKANINTINVGVDNAEDLKKLIDDKIMMKRLALVPYLQEGKISDNALDFVNEHMMTFSDSDIEKITTFRDENQNEALGQEFIIQENGKPKHLLIQLHHLI